MRPAFIIVCIQLFFISAASAFPELTRHNYNNCMVCHISPTGGGVLSEYGRSLSKELVSTWGYEGEEKFFYFIPTTEALALGGDFRNLQLKDKLPTGVKRELWIPMQRDLEIAATIGKWVTAVTVGENTRATEGSKLLSRRHYVMKKISENLTVRGGKFYPAFGLHIPDHSTVIRRGLGWDQGRETYNLEGAWQGEKWHYFTTAIVGRPDDTSVVRERGLTFSMAYHPTADSKYGLSYYYGESPDAINHFIGPYAVIGLSERFHFMGQITAIRSHPYSATEHQWGLVDYLKLNFEPYKGIHFFLAQEFSQTNLNSNATRTDIHSVGFQFFPRPHFEIQVMEQRLYSQGVQTTPTERLNVVLHYYP